MDNGQWTMDNVRIQPMTQWLHIMKSLIYERRAFTIVRCPSYHLVFLIVHCPLSIVHCPPPPPASGWGLIGLICNLQKAAGQACFVFQSTRLVRAISVNG